ncbi:MAG: SDR family oxidoreductase [Candidatus Firestonebacteria bacterium]|nr:SDR family oxidoreductase [Candidatus Firestonebacteria bacterium]
MKNILILGANSAMARALARQAASPNTQLVLAGRHVKEMEKTAADLGVRSNGPKPGVLAFDAQAMETHEKFWQQVLAKFQVIDEVYVFFGQMHPQVESQRDFRLAEEMLVTNYVGAVSILEKIAATMEARKAGLIVGVSSVAGDRGRRSNYLYGSSKAGLNSFLSGLRNRLVPAGVHVMTVKPGFVDTPMTADLKKGILYAKPEAVARGILKAAARRKDEVYLPFFWRWIMLIIIHIPEGVFKKLKL